MITTVCTLSAKKFYIFFFDFLVLDFYADVTLLISRDVKAFGSKNSFLRLTLTKKKKNNNVCPIFTHGGDKERP